MRKLIVGLVFVLAGAVNAFGQSTTVSGQVTDNGSQSWNNATCQFQFVPNPNIPTFQSYTWTGGALSQVVNCTTNGSGAYSVSVPSNTAISPGGSKWILQVTPNATSPSFSTPATTIPGGTQTLNVTPRAIAISWSLPPGPAISAYADAEITGTLPKGAEYFNTTTLLTRVWNGSAWANQGSGSGSGCTPSGGAGVVQASNGSGGCEATSITDNGTTVTTAENFQALGNASTLSTIIAGAHQLNGITVTGGSGTTVSAIESGQTLILDADAGISMTINSGRITANGDFVNIGNTSTGLISGLAQGPTSANVLEVTPSATTVAADESGGTVSIAANSNVSITSSTGQVQLTPGSGSFIALGSATTVPAAGSPTFSGCALGAQSDRSVAGTTDTIVAADRCNRVVYTSATAVAVTLPQAGTTGFANGFFYATSNGGAGVVTITPTAPSTINGNTTLVLNEGDACRIGPNSTGASYAADCAPPQLIAGTGITLTPGVHSLTIASTASATPSFSAISSGTNTTAAMILGTGSSLTVSGSGTNNATTLGGATFAAPGPIGGTTPAAGTFTTLTTTGLATFPLNGCATPSLGFTGATTTGLSVQNSGQVLLCDGGTAIFRSIGQSTAWFSSSALIGWGSNADADAGSFDTSCLRLAANSIGCGNGTGGNTTASFKVAKYLTDTNCQSSGGTCGSASAGQVSIAAAATTVTVATTAVTANSEIFIQEDSTLGTALSVTCNTTIARSYVVTTRTAATSFVITASAAPTVNPACLSYRILN